MRRTTTNLTPLEEQAQCRHLYEVEQLPIARIAAHLGVAQGTVQRRLADAGVRRRPAGKHLKGLRREAATDLLRAGWDPEKVAELLPVGTVDAR